MQAKRLYSLDIDAGELMPWMRFSLRNARHGGRPYSRIDRPHGFTASMYVLGRRAGLAIDPADLRVRLQIASANTPTRSGHPRDDRIFVARQQNHVSVIDTSGGL